jgi:acetolactate synthase-1/3 small subunit
VTAIEPSTDPAAIRTGHLVAVVVDEAMIPLDRVLGAVRRRNLPFTSLSVGPGPVAGVVRVFLQVHADPGDVDRLVRQLRKLVGVRQALVRQADSVGVRQLALVRLSSPGLRRTALLAAATQHRMRLIADRPGSVELELSGSPDELEDGLRALAPYGILDVARSSPVVLEDERPATPGSHFPSRQDDRS